MTSTTPMQPNPRKTFSVRRLGSVDVAPLRAAVAAIPEDVWNAEKAAKPNRFETLGSTRHIVFRFVSNFLDWRGSYDGPLWPECRPLLDPVLAAATADYGYAHGAFPRMMLARMAPGGVIHPHRDTNPAAQWPHKIHVPLETSREVDFFIDGAAYQFPVGEAVEVNNMATHAVANRGATDRIHLIFEYYDRDQPEPDWLPALAAAAQGRANA